jgi:hypothetical protein
MPTTEAVLAKWNEVLRINDPKTKTRLPCAVAKSLNVMVANCGKEVVAAAGSVKKAHAYLLAAESALAAAVLTGNPAIIGAASANVAAAAESVSLAEAGLDAAEASQAQAAERLHEHLQTCSICHPNPRQNRK